MVECLLIPTQFYANEIDGRVAASHDDLADYVCGGS